MAFKKNTTIYESAPRPFIQCSHEACTFEAICRVFTKTGWANVCKAHYLTTETVPHVTRNFLCDELRAAHQARKEGKSRIGAVLPKLEREPGMDDEPALGIPLDDLEREFADAANP